MASKKEREAEKIEAAKTLRKLGVKPGAKIFTCVKQVSRSGMSRHIALYIVTTETSHGKRSSTIFDISGYAARLLGYRRADDGGLIVGGCGMDMCFHTVYNLGRAMFPKGGPVAHSARRHQEERDGKTIEIDGGYLLSKRDL